MSVAAARELPAQVSIAYQNWHRFSRNPTAVIGSVIVIVVVAAALLAPWIAPYPDHVGAMVNFRARHLPPSAQYWFGTDNVGRDIFTRVLFGYRVSLLLAAVVLGFAVPLGATLGLIAGYFGGWAEIVIMRLTDIALAIPPLVMALAVTAVLTPNLTHAMLAIAALWWTWHTRLIFSITRTLRQQEFVEAAQTLGASRFHILFRELLPNCASAILVKTSLDFGFVILIGAALSYLGLGVQPPTPDLGTMVANGADFLPDRWWESLLPGAAILFVALGFNLLGDGLRDLYDVESVQMSADPLLSVRSLSVDFSILRPPLAGAARRLARRSRASPCGAGRRIRLRQERDDAGDHGDPVDAAGPHRLRRDPFRRPRSLAPAAARARGAARHGDVDGVPGPDDLAQSGLHHRRPDGDDPEIRRPAARPRPRPDGAPGARPRGARASAHA